MFNDTNNPNTMIRTKIKILNTPKKLKSFVPWLGYFVCKKIQKEIQTTPITFTIASSVESPSWWSVMAYNMYCLLYTSRCV